MADREKLIELISTAPFNPVFDVVVQIGDRFTEKYIADIADHLIANGVSLETKQATSDENKRWIPVTERLPEIGRNVLVVDRVTGGVSTAHLNDFNWFVFSDGRGHGASHWMPLPEPPKEGE